jgi:hypothetical protein
MDKGAKLTLKPSARFVRFSSFSLELNRCLASRTALKEKVRRGFSNGHRASKFGMISGWMMMKMTQGSLASGASPGWVLGVPQRKGRVGQVAERGRRRRHGSAHSAPSSLDWCE